MASELPAGSDSSLVPFGTAWGAAWADVRHLPGEPQAVSSGDSGGLLTSARIRWLMVRMVPKVSH
jgi:hypothetical protein